MTIFAKHDTMTSSLKLLSAVALAVPGSLAAAQGSAAS